jgi:hypothetical protein
MRDLSIVHRRENAMGVVAACFGLDAQDGVGVQVGCWTKTYSIEPINIYTI